LGAACRLLGVDQSTLRRWADSGQVRTFRTPGGHRRFAEEDIRAIVGGPRPSGQEQDVGDLATSRIRRHLRRGKEQRAPWYTGIDQKSRERLRLLGQRVTSLVSAYFSRSGRKAALLQEARETGRMYGRELAASGLSLSQSVQAFAFFRHSLDQAAREAGRKGSLPAEATLRACEQIGGLSDEVLIGIVEAYEEEV
jgi:excisionase family DNA binding protein